VARFADTLLLPVSTVLYYDFSR